MNDKRLKGTFGASQYIIVYWKDSRLWFRFDEIA